MSDMKPVPCGCGGEAEVIKHTFRDAGVLPCYGVTCKKCGTASWHGFDTESEAVTAWNKAMSGNVQECAKDARCSERTAKAEWSEVDGCHLCGECGFAVCPNCDVYCAGCGARLEWE